MKVQKTIYIFLKSVFYLVMALSLLVFDGDSLKYISIFIFIILGLLSILYGSSNKAIKLIEKRNYLIGGTTLLFAILFFFANQFFFGVEGVLAIYLVILAGLQITSTLLTGISNAKENQLLKMLRFAIPLLSIIPAGLILGEYFDETIGKRGNNIILAILFIGAACINFIFIKNQKKLLYTVRNKD